jgi:hypothetical protein
MLYLLFPTQVLTTSKVPSLQINVLCLNVRWLVRNAIDRQFWYDIQAENIRHSESGVVVGCNMRFQQCKLWQTRSRIAILVAKKNLICKRNFGWNIYIIFIPFYLLLNKQKYSVFENCALLGYYAANSDNFLTTVWVPWVGGPETSVRNYHYSLHNNPEEFSGHLLPGGWDCQISRLSAHEGCQPYAPAAFTPRKYSWYSLNQTKPN